MNDTPGIEEELKTRLSEIVNKDLSKRQVEKIVDLFASDKGNTITDEDELRDEYMGICIKAQKFLLLQQFEDFKLEMDKLNQFTILRKPNSK